MSSKREKNKKQRLEDQELQENIGRPENNYDNYGRSTESDEIPITGNGYSLVDVPIDEVDFSDLVDLSDPEDMEKHAREVTPDEIPDLVDSDAAEMSKFTRDEDILEDFSERQQVTSGTEQIIETLKDYTGESPDLTGEDIDARWEGGDQSGEESVGGSVAVPEQNDVEDLGEALGIEYNDFESLNTEEKIDARDVHRWELDPASADDRSEADEYDEDPDDETADEKYNDLMSGRAEMDDSENGDSAGYDPEDE
jgi:hypothetical protein